MPTKIRAMLTALVVFLAIALWLGRTQIGLSASPFLYFALCTLICGAIWMFPEVKKENPPHHKD